MQPIEFPEQNFVYAKNQPQYKPLPCHRTHEGQVISCWSLTWGERVRLLFTGRLWISVLTFNHPLQPIAPLIDYPFIVTSTSTKDDHQ